VREALRRVLVQEMLWHRVARLAIAYEQYGAAERLLKGNRVRIDAVEFADHVTLTVAVPHDHTAQVAIGLADLTGGRVSLDICWIGERYDAADQTSQ
jgi:putative IMPACT (imprinted ancient) family translation regulator